MNHPEYTIILFYKYVALADPESTCLWQKLLCEQYNLKGRIIISGEGINATLEGRDSDIRKYIKAIEKYTKFKDIHFKKSTGNGLSFPKLSVKLRSELVSANLGSHDINPQKVTGKYIDAKELHSWFTQQKEFYIVDMRNDYEYRVGFFENSILSQFQNFRDLPKIIQKLEHLKHKTVVTVCTGGVRCEKASGFLIENGFSDVYQLYGGIVTYMEEYPNEHFLGKLYVFDNRIIMGFNTSDPKHVVVGKCAKCGNSSELYVNCSDERCHQHFICCEDCREPTGESYCNENCKAKVLKVDQIQNSKI